MRTKESDDAISEFGIARKARLKDKKITKWGKEERGCPHRVFPI